MADYVQPLGLVANGTINPAVFVKGDTSNDLYALQCSAKTDQPIGVSGTFTNTLPVSGAAQAPEAAGTPSGDNLNVYMAGAVCLLTAGTGGWTPFKFLTSDSNGCGVVPAGSSGAYVSGAMSLTTVSAGGQGRVLVLPPGVNLTA